MTVTFLLKKPSAILPMALSAAALTIVLVHAAFYGVAHEADEGTAAHLWQLLMAAQAPVLIFFAFRWLPRDPKRALLVMALQGGAAIMAVAPVYFLRL